MAQVAREFAEKQKKPGARQAARALQVSLASFYNYAAGTDLPRLEVLRRAHKIWGIKWPSWIDTSEVVRTQNVRTPEQLVFAFLDAVREGDVEIVQVSPLGQSVLQVKLNIHFLTPRVKNAVEGS
jgi:transcriptional regulator with XRE-family HTH domain